MDKDFFTYLPSEIVFVIFSKLPVQSIGICKCVCKSWRNLVGTHEFVKFHLSQSTPCLVIAIRKNKGSYNIFEINDDLDLEHHELHYRLSTEFVFPHYATLRGSANGLLFFYGRSTYNDRRLYICNPITRDYIELPKVSGNATFSTYGFGASKMSGQHKVVGIFHGFRRRGCRRATKSECRVYTLGTRSWRRIAASSAANPLIYGESYPGAVFVNGNLHWLVTFEHDVNNNKQLISCFDLEAEVFSTFPPPRHEKYCGRLCVVGNWLCFCERIDDVMSIWLAKEEKCWTKEFVIPSNICRPYIMYPIKVFKDGDILIAPLMPVYNAKTTKTTQKLGVFDLINPGESVIYTPSFLSLKSFGMETATSL